MDHRETPQTLSLRDIGTASGGGLTSRDKLQAGALYMRTRIRKEIGGKRKDLVPILVEVLSLIEREISTTPRSPVAAAAAAATIRAPGLARIERERRRERQLLAPTEILGLRPEFEATDHTHNGFAETLPATQLAPGA